MKRLIILVPMLLTLSGCVGIARHVVKRVQSENAASHVVVTGDIAPPPAVRTALEDVVRQGADGVTAIVMRDGKRLFRMDVGKVDPNTQYEIASASKWMTAALVMTVVDEGKLSLDEPIAKHLPMFQGDAGTVTLRQLLAQTSGQGSLRNLVDIRQNPRITLAESAAEVARRPLEDAPGTVFKYGGPGFQVAGALVEAVTQRRWVDLFEERIARPLGMTHTTWKHVPDRGVSPQDTTNPLLQGGVVTTADDYMRFLTMLTQGGQFENHRVLSTQAIDTMETVQTLGKPMAYVPRGVVTSMQYALGNWCETWAADGRCIVASSPGAFGTFPWIDRESGLYGIFFVKDRLPRIVSSLRTARIAIKTMPIH